MKIKKMFILIIMALVFTSCESGFDEMMDEAQTGIKFYRHYAYVVNYDSNTVSAYSVSTDGFLTWISDNATGTKPRFVKGTPNGKYLYVSNYISNTISVYFINADGSLTAVGSPVAAGSYPGWMTINAAGTYLYVATSDGSGNGRVAAFSINSSGALTPLPSSPYSIKSPTALTVDPSGKYLLITGFPDGTNYGYAAYPINSTTGELNTTYTSYRNTPGQNGNSIIMDNYGHVYVGIILGWISACSIDSSGILTLIGSYVPTPELGGTNSLAVDPNNKYLFAASISGDSAGTFPDGAVSVFKINSSTGVLTEVDNYLGAGCTQPSSLAVDSKGSYLYVTNRASNNITIFKINDDDTLTQMDNVTAGTSPNSIALIKREQ
jgi:6-phosphogluconolactonase (cycloisomerase 2 family)